MRTLYKASPHSSSPRRQALEQRTGHPALAEARPHDPGNSTGFTQQIIQNYFFYLKLFLLFPGNSTGFTQIISFWFDKKNLCRLCCQAAWGVFSSLEVPAINVNSTGESQNAFLERAFEIPIGQLLSWSAKIYFLYELLASKVLPTARSAGSNLREPPSSKALTWYRRWFWWWLGWWWWW